MGTINILALDTIVNGEIEETKYDLAVYENGMGPNVYPVEEFGPRIAWSVRSRLVGRKRYGRLEDMRGRSTLYVSIWDEGEDSPNKVTRKGVEMDSGEEGSIILLRRLNDKERADFGKCLPDLIR